MHGSLREFANGAKDRRKGGSSPDYRCQNYWTDGPSNALPQLLKGELKF